MSFEYQPEAYIREVRPLSTRVSGGSIVTVLGSHFDPLQTVCRFGLETVPAIFLSPQEIRCITPPSPFAADAALAVSTNN
eukprot:50196-Eustigmatos_ZCMA.PRE.1